ncbi:hypothetical protein H8E88_35045 [candidate division KSB1 bacterium]|nr:hypothetical protein [candidate division KSB1 bacterium]
MMMGIGLSIDAVPEQRDSTASQLLPGSLRVTIDPGEFRWRRFRYEAEMRVSAIYPAGSKLNRPESLIIFVDVETPGTTFWNKISGDKERYERSDQMTLTKGQDQVTGKLCWRISNNVKVTVNAGKLKQTAETSINFPIFLLLFCTLGGALGGWLRRTRDPKSVVDIPVQILSKKMSHRLEPLRESFVSMVAGILLYLLNLVSPVYLELRSELSQGWLVLIPPLLIGFSGGWGGIYLLVGFLNQIFHSAKPGKNAGSKSPEKPNGR